MIDVAHLGCPAHIQDLTLSEVQQLRHLESAKELVCGRERVQMSGQIPTLRSVLELCKIHGLKVTVELKGISHCSMTQCHCSASCI